MNRNSKIICLLLLVVGGCGKVETQKKNDSGIIPVPLILSETNNFLERSKTLENRIRDEFFRGEKKPTTVSVEDMKFLELKPLVSQKDVGETKKEEYRFTFMLDFVNVDFSLTMKEIEGKHYFESRWLGNDDVGLRKYELREISSKKWDSLVNVLEKNEFWKETVTVSIEDLTTSIHPTVCFIEAYKNGDYNFHERFVMEGENSKKNPNSLCNYFYNLVISQQHLNYRQQSKS